MTLDGAALMGLAPPREDPPAIAETAEVNPADAPGTQPANAAMMIDATHEHVANIPRTIGKVAGYDTGSPDIDWTGADWGDFPHAGKVHIDQSDAFARYAAGTANVADVENGTGSPAQFVIATKERNARGENGWIYGSRATVEYTAGLLAKSGADLKRTGAWLADWNLSETEAEALIGTEIGGIRIVAAQWASPSSNPDTVVPEGTQTLAEAQVDLSVTEADWFAAGGLGVSVAQARAALDVLTRFIEQ